MTRRLGLLVTDASPLITLAAGERNVTRWREPATDEAARLPLRRHLDRT